MCMCIRRAQSAERIALRAAIQAGKAEDSWQEAAGSGQKKELRIAKLGTRPKGGCPKDNCGF
jgi:hypothetical protein